MSVVGEPRDGVAGPIADKAPAGFGATIGAWARRRETAEHGGMLWLGLVVGLFLLLPAATPRMGVVIWGVVLFVTLLVSLRYRIGPAAISIMVVAGFTVRLAMIGASSSDALIVTVAAIERVIGGGSPWGVGYAETIPPGAPFPYGPLALLWYLPAKSLPEIMEILASTVVLVLLGIRGRPVGLAIFAFAPMLTVLATDGSNDSSAGLLLLGAILVMQRSRAWGGAALAGAAAFKIYALAWLPALLWFGRLPALAGFGLASVAIWLPAFVAWGPGAFLESFSLSQRVHPQAYYSLGYALRGLGIPVAAEAIDRVRLVLAAIVVVATAAFVRSSRGVVVAGLAVYLVTLYAGWWSTFAYLAAIAPIVCWHLEDWTGLGERRVRWPGDPVGRVTARVDGRWPILGTTS
ncbi:MAG TPA: hypothetical protein VIF44_07160 [Candidatus Limnocylindrales bacterium]|jgi:hypothetical protein